MIPINEMTEVMKTCKIVQKQRFQVHQWVRIKAGIYKDDLGLIEMVDGNKKALVRLIPRIPDDFFGDPTKTISSLRAYSKQSPFIRVPQLLFNPMRVKSECQRELYKPLKKNFYCWRKMMFRNGFLYQEFSAAKLITENVCPSLKEVKMFQVDAMTQSHLYEYEDDDQDEWDLLDDQTLQ
jgi:transcription elongation factor